MTFAPFWRDVGLREGTFANARTKDPGKILMLVELWT
jgi:hypothetical protein